MSKTRIVLRDEISGQTTEYSAVDAERILAHPVWGKRNKEVRVNKPEVLKASSSSKESTDETPKPSARQTASTTNKKDAN